MEKLMKTSKIVDTILKVAYTILKVSGIIIFVCVGIGVLIQLLGKMPTAELTGISVNEMEFQFVTPQTVSSSYAIAEMVTVMIMALIAIFASCYLIKVLRKVLAPMIVGQPFDGTVSTNIKKLGITIMIAGIGLDIVKAIASSMALFMHDFSDVIVGENVAYVSINHEISLLPILTGVLVILLSHVFRYGEELQQQADETL